MGLRPNQPRRLVAAPPRCRHTGPPVPVEVHDTLDGSPEVVCWLCPTCLEETRPPPRFPGELSSPSDAADITPLIVNLAAWGMTAEEASISITRSLRGC